MIARVINMDQSDIFQRHYSILFYIYHRHRFGGSYVKVKFLKEPRRSVKHKSDSSLFTSFSSFQIYMHSPLPNTTITYDYFLNNDMTLPPLHPLLQLENIFPRFYKLSTQCKFIACSPISTYCPDILYNINQQTCLICEARPYNVCYTKKQKYENSCENYISF